jgi:hypothetical protein
LLGWLSEHYLLARSQAERIILTKQMRGSGEQSVRSLGPSIGASPAFLLSLEYYSAALNVWSTVFESFGATVIF